MNNFAFLFAALTPVFVLFARYKSDQVHINQRISSFIFREKTVSELLSIKRKFNIPNKKSKINGLPELAASADFGDLFAVALVSGQNPRAGIEIIAEYLTPNFELGIRKAIRENAFGKPLMTALSEMVEQKETRVLKPLIKQMETAIERGTPLADVSRAFAEDQRLKFRNLLMKQAAAKEISMLVPVVFVVLPSVLAVAMYPALTVLQQLG
jgi:pilus assembly protein TadC